MKDKPKVALSGASGAIGTVLRPRLVERGIDLRSAGGTKPLQALSAAEEVMHGDLRDPAVVDRLLARRRRVDPYGRHQRRAAAAGDQREQPARTSTRSTKARAATASGGSCSRARTTLSACTRSRTSSGSTPRFGPTASTASARSGAKRWRGCTGTSTASKAFLSGSAARWRSRRSSAISAHGSVTTTSCG